MSNPHQWAQAHDESETETAVFKKPRIYEGNHTWNPPADSQLMNYSNNLSAQSSMRRPPRLNPSPQNASSRPLTALFYKTRLCLKFRTNSCRLGVNCTYAHGPEELRKPPANWAELIPSDRTIKTCNKFARGEVCPYGASCVFPHQRRQTRESAAAGVSASNSSNMVMAAAASNGWNGNGAHPQQQSAGSTGASTQRPQLWKTKTCHQWETTGRCQYGAQCHYAHGFAEPRRFGSHLDASSTTSVGAVPNSLLSIPPATSAQGKNADRQKKGFRRWKMGDKINGIYGDWIDDLSTDTSLTFKSGLKAKSMLARDMGES